MTERVLVIRNWSEFQHYKDRDPPWIKLYRDTLTSEVWVLGTDVSRLVQMASTLLAARYRNEIPMNFELWREVAKIRCTEAEFEAAIKHLCKWKFARVQEVEEDDDESASSSLATCASKEPALYSEGEQSRADSASVPAASPAKRAKSRTVIPPDLSLDDGMREAILKRFPDCDAEEAFRQFHAHHTAKGSLMLSWRAAWTTWIGNAERFGYPKRRLTSNGIHAGVVMR